MLKDFGSFLKKEKVSPLTKKNYLSDVRSYFRWIKDQTAPNEKPGSVKTLLAREKIWQYWHHLVLTDKLSQNTVKRKLAGLKKFCQWAQDKGLIKCNPFEKKDIKDIKDIKDTEEAKPACRLGREIKGIKAEIIKIGFALCSTFAGIAVLSASLTKFALPPEVEPTPLPRVLSQTSGFAKDLVEIKDFGILGGIGLSATESSLLGQLANQGQLVLPESLRFEAKDIALKTTDGYDGNITFNPDGQGTLNLLFEGLRPSRGGFVNIQNANLTAGNLIYAQVANNQAGFNFLQFQGGTNLANRFTVDGKGNVKAAGKLFSGSGQIQSSKNLIFSPQDQVTLTLAPKQSHLKGNLSIAGQLYDGGLGIFGTTGEILPQVFDFTKELTTEFDFLTGTTDLTIKFNLNKAQDKYYQVIWQTSGKFAIQACDSTCSSIGSIAWYPFEEQSWHHGRIFINDSWLTWELDLSSQKIRVPVQIEAIPLLEKGHIQFSQSFKAIANLKISQGGHPILTSGHGRIGGNLQVSGEIHLGEISDESASTHVCYNADGKLSECSADYSEWYPVAFDATTASEIIGTLVSITNIPNPTNDPTARFMATPSNRPYHSNLLGVLANPSLGANGKKLSETYQPLVLAGRVPVKVSDIGGPIEVGDPITSSEIPGAGIRATKPGAIVGTALEPWPSSQLNQLNKLDKWDVKTGQILVLINPGWWEPKKSEERVVDIEKSNLKSSKSEFAKLVDNAESPEILNPSSAAGRQVQDDKKEIKLTSLIIERLRTTGQAEFANQLIAQNLQVAGEATFTGQLTAEALTTETAEIDHLVAGEIESETITVLEDNFGNLIARVEQLETEESADGTGMHSSEVEAVPAGRQELASNDSKSSETSVLLADVEQFIQELQEIQASSSTKDIISDINIADAIEIADGSLPQLVVTGLASLGQTTIAGNLLVDSSLQLAANSINSLDNTLYLQNYGFGGLDILGGKVKIDKLGNLAVAGSVEVEKDLKVKKSLFASLIKPLEGEEITIDGNLKAKGGTFDKIVIASAKTEGGDEISAGKTLRVENSKPEGLGNAEISTNATAGTAILPARETNLTIINEAITDNSLIYITPLSPTENKVLFVKAKRGPTDCPDEPRHPGVSDQTQFLSPLPDENVCFPEPGYFTVGIDEAISQNISFNWWVIN